MARRSFTRPGDAHELTFSCYRRLPLLCSDEVCELLAKALNLPRRKHNFDTWAYVIMPDHVHLIIRPREQDYSIGGILKSIKQASSQAAIAHFKTHSPRVLEKMVRTDTRGAMSYRFWQAGGGFDRNLFTPRAIRSAIDYIHANPARARLVGDIQDWKWSSIHAYLGACNPPIPIDTCDMM